MFHINTIFHQMISLDDTILEWEYYIFHAYTIWHYVDTGFDDILCKNNRDLVLLVLQETVNLVTIFFVFLASLFLIFFINFSILLVPFLIFYFNFSVFFVALPLKMFLHLRIFSVPHFLIVYFHFRVFSVSIFLICFLHFKIFVIISFLIHNFLEFVFPDICLFYTVLLILFYCYMSF